ncbi:RecB family exonuclease [Spirillospora sp. NPDC127200]
MFHLSPSRLQSYSKCGLAYRLEKILRVPQRAAAWFVQGSAVHEALEAYECSHRCLSVAEAVNIFHASWDKILAESRRQQPDESMWMVGGRKKLETDLTQRRAAGAQQVADYIGARPPGGGLAPTHFTPDTIAVEVGFDLDFDGVRVLGYIDVVHEAEDGRLIPEDWKTGAHMPADPYQLATYRWAIHHVTGEAPDWGQFWMCRENKAHRVDLRPYTWERVCGWYRDLAAGIEAGVFLGNPGDHCFTCTVRPYCDAVQPYPLTLMEAA